MRRALRPLGIRAAGTLGPAFVRALHATLRIEVHGREHYEEPRADGRRVLFAVWHDRLLTPVWWHRGEAITVLISEHADGEVLARVMAGLGFRAARGSSTRGGARGMRALVRAARRGQDLAITPDGPRGPRHVVKPGLVLAAQLSGALIVPLSAASRDAWVLGSWDRFQVPRPRSHTVLEYGSGIAVPRGSSDGERTEILAGVQHALDTLTARVDARAGRPHTPSDTRGPVGAPLD